MNLGLTRIAVGAVGATLGGVMDDEQLPVAGSTAVMVP
jgi:hypothetical protein